MRAAAQDPAAVAKLVHEATVDAAKLSDALRSPNALVRATAARVAGIRDAKGALPALREAVATESDATAIREEVRTLALIGEPAHVELAVGIAAKSTQSLDIVVVDAVGRRGGQEAVDLYFTKLAPLRGKGQFFGRALWGQPDVVGPTAGRLLEAKNEGGWRALIGELLDAGLGPPAERVLAALESPSEDIRQTTLWYLVRGFAPDAGRMNPRVRDALLAERSEKGSDREDYARELLRRMHGRAASDPQRWLAWLATPEADRTLPVEPAVYTYLTPEEHALRESRCKALPVYCPVPPKKGRVIPSSDVARAAFALPGTLPAGLDDALQRGKACEWLGVGSATVDRAGRVQSTDLRHVTTNCRDVLQTILKLSYATNATIASDTTSHNILLVKGKKATPCLDEVVETDGTPHRVGGNVVAPIVKKRVEPYFPDSARRSMGQNSSVLVIAEAVISRTGCVRSINLLRQSPFPELNGAAVKALSQWEFEPGRLDGRPVDVIFNLTMNFKIN